MQWSLRSTAWSFIALQIDLKRPPDPLVTNVTLLHFDEQISSILEPEYFRVNDSSRLLAKKGFLYRALREYCKTVPGCTSIGGQVRKEEMIQRLHSPFAKIKDSYIQIKEWEMVFLFAEPSQDVFLPPHIP